MIKVLFDHEIFSEQMYGGISRYFANIAKEMNKGKTVRVKIGILYVKNYYVRNLWQPYNNFIGRKFLKKDTKRYAKNKKYSEKLLKSGSYDIYHATYYDTYALHYISKPLVLTIHDMIHEDSPHMFANSEKIIEQKKAMMDVASSIIAISNYTKERVLAHYPQHSKKITVVYHGLPLKTNAHTKIEVSLPNKFILFVGERTHYKSFTPFVSAIASLLLAEKNLNLIAAGGKDFTSEELDMFSMLGIKDQCLQLNVSDELLDYLYQRSLVFAYPSTQEGFGFPILEAFKNNCPVACSNSSCLPEIAGDAASFFDTNDPSSILSTIEKIISNPVYANELKEKGNTRLKEFTLEKCVAETVKVYQNLVSS